MPRAPPWLRACCLLQQIWLRAWCQPLPVGSIMERGRAGSQDQPRVCRAGWQAMCSQRSQGTDMLLAPPDTGPSVATGCTEAAEPGARCADSTWARAGWARLALGAARPQTPSLLKTRLHPFGPSSMGPARSRGSRRCHSRWWRHGKGCNGQCLDWLGSTDRPLRAWAGHNRCVRSAQTCCPEHSQPLQAWRPFTLGPNNGTLHSHIINHFTAAHFGNALNLRVSQDPNASLPGLPASPTLASHHSRV